MNVNVVAPDGTLVNAAPVVFPDGASLPEPGDFIFGTAPPAAPLWKVRCKVWGKPGGVITVYIITDITTITTASFVIGG